jgi:hypothetical protein
MYGRSKRECLLGRRRVGVPMKHAHFHLVPVTVAPERSGASPVGSTANATRDLEFAADGLQIDLSLQDLYPGSRSSQTHGHGASYTAMVVYCSSHVA